MTEELISVIEIAKAHGKHRQTIHRILKRLGVETTKMQSSEARGQLADGDRRHPQIDVASEKLPVSTPVERNTAKFPRFPRRHSAFPPFQR